MWPRYWKRIVIASTQLQRRQLFVRMCPWYTVFAGPQRDTILKLSDGAFHLITSTVRAWCAANPIIAETSTASITLIV